MLIPDKLFEASEAEVIVLDASISDNDGCRCARSISIWSAAVTAALVFLEKKNTKAMAITAERVSCFNWA